MFKEIFVYAVDNINSTGLKNPLAGNLNENINSIPGFIKSILGLIMYMGIPFIGLILVYAGFKFLFARGKREQIKTATFNIQWVIIGIGVFLGAWALTTLIDSTINSIMH